MRSPIDFAAPCESRRSMNTCPIRRAAQPKSGILPSSCLAMNRSGSGETDTMAGTSMWLVWLETKT